MNFVHRRNLVDRLVSLDRFDRHLGLEALRVIPALCHNPYSLQQSLLIELYHNLPPYTLVRIPGSIIDPEAKVDFDELVNFYLRNRNPIERQREYQRLYVEKRMTGVMNPLTGGGVGSEWTMSGGGYEMAVAFAYLASYAIGGGDVPTARALDFRGPHVKDAIDKMLGQRRMGMRIPHFHEGLEKVKKWVSECNVAWSEKEKEEIAAAKVEEKDKVAFGSAFAEGLSGRSYLTSHFLRKGYFRVRENVTQKLQNLRIGKEFLVHESCTALNRLGKRIGENAGQGVNNYILRWLCGGNETACDHAVEEYVKVVVNEKAVGEAVQKVKGVVDWLKGQSCPLEDGLIVFVGVGPNEVLAREKDYVPAWREEGVEPGFEGFYRGYRIAQLRGQKLMPACAGVVLRGWSGIDVQTKVTRDKLWGRVVAIRELTEKEVAEIIGGDGGKVTEAKGDCIIESELLFRLPDVRPVQMFVALGAGGKQSSRRRWSGEDDALLRELHGQAGIQELAEEFGRSAKAIQARLRKLGLQ